MKPVLSLLLLATAPLWSQIVPAPKEVEEAAGTVDAGFAVQCDVLEFAPQAEALVAALQRLGVERAAVARRGEAGVVVRIERGKAGGSAGYRIEPRGGVMVVTAESSQGVAHGAASLVQLARVEGGKATWPSVRLRDAPDRPFRCFMVDMGRNPHSPKTLRHVVDMAWYYKVNYLHLHLSDDQLFSWPSRVFPKLYSARAGWTWEDFVALESYSQARGVTIIPEIDVPGHSTILRRAYPEVFGKTPTDLATIPTSRKGLEKLLTEILSVFRATPYVHIGGDEAYGVPGDAQRDFINAMNAFIRSRGKRTLVWEGPRLGRGKHKVDTSVIHLNWRTIDFPAQDMLDAGYEVVNAAWDPLYVVDHYPRTMITAVDVERCYGWDIRRFAHINQGMPTFGKPHRTTGDKGLLGFCMPWWEGREKNVMGLCLPRLAAVASAAWNRKGESDFKGFEARQSRLIPRIEKISGFRLPELPYAAAETQKDNVAYRGRVTPSSGASQPVFGPQRLTNGITDRFDRFLGFPTKPEPLEIVVELQRAARVGRVVVHEAAVGKSHEIYELFVSADGKDYERVGSSGKGSRGENAFVAHTFEPRQVRYLKIATQGCHGLTFPSFSRLTEVQAFEK